MRLSFREADFDKLATLWNEFYPPEFAIDAALLKQNTVDSPVFDWGASVIDVMDDEVLGFLAIKQASTKLYATRSPDTSHVSALAYRKPDSGIDMLSEAKRLLRNRGQTDLVFGMDSRHFFPGCPSTAASLCSFLMVEGFQDGGECFDLERDLANYEPPLAIPDSATYRAVRLEEKDALSALIQQEFSARWRFDTLSKLDIEGQSSVFGAFDGDQIIGFALIQDETQKLPIGGATWRKSLGPKWGSLGPIGVAQSHRGQHLGHGLLASSLLELKNRGVKQCIIDWTILTDFYGRHGFKVTRTYQGKSLKLGD